MRHSILIPVLLLNLAVPIAAHAQSGSLSGVVSGPDGTGLPEATVLAVNNASGDSIRVRSDFGGSYSLDGLSAGTYTVTAAMPCCSFMPYTEEGVVVGSDRIELDLSLPETLVILSDDPALFNAARRAQQELENLPVPRDAAGRPDLSGVWFHSMDPLQDEPVPLPWAAELAQSRLANMVRDHPHNQCLPGEIYAPGAASFMLRLVQTPDLLVILFEDVPGFRQVFLDGRGHPTVSNPTWMGHSVGHWEGDTLVVETVDINDKGWNEVYPRTEQMKLIERFTRNEYGRVDVVVTIDDPGVFEVPWTRRMQLDLADGEDLFEYVCETNKWGPTNED